ncbi:hypothetical protein EV361DRAFT_489193 [Lentinula raphanica]|nr:hypothetical protein EV361DRAFT_489193 [Lentinula raphanica]
MAIFSPLLIPLLLLHPLRSMMSLFLSILVSLPCDCLCFFSHSTYLLICIFIFSHQPNSLTSWLAEERSVLLSDLTYLHHLRVSLQWKSVLEKILISDHDLALTSFTDNIVTVIQEMKDVPKKTFSTPQFRLAMKNSDLTHVIESICHPSFILLNRNTHLLHLEHLYRISDQLAEVLDLWTPSFISSSWDIDSGHFISEKPGNKVIDDPKDLIQLLDDNSSNVPGEDNLSFCFFLCSFESFSYNYNRWLAIFLENRDYDLMNFNNIATLENFYTLLMSLIHQWLVCSSGLPG